MVRGEVQFSWTHEVRERGREEAWELYSVEISRMDVEGSNGAQEGKQASRAGVTHEGQTSGEAEGSQVFWPR